MQHHAQHGDFGPRVHNPAGRGSVLLVCEHASARIPPEFQDLGLDRSDLDSHIAWDPGAFETAKGLSAALDAPLVCSTVSRLVYDCNRPPDADDAMPACSEDTPIPGNTNLTASDRQSRIARYYHPFEALLSETLDDRPGVTALVTVHSFTPVYRGQARSVEVGILHDRDSRLADALLQVATGFNIQRNAPYGPEDGVTHTLRHHALPRDTLNVMIEVRNDLIASSEQCARMADILADWVSRALAQFPTSTTAEAGG